MSNDVIRPIHYLGSKLRMLESIKEAIDSVDRRQGPICDLFAGSGTVSKYMIQHRDVIAVDIQQYSVVLCEAAINSVQGKINIESIIDEIIESEVTQEIKKALDPLLEYERKSIERANAQDINDIYDIIENGSIYIMMNKPEQSMPSDILRSCILDSIDNLKKSNLDQSLDTMITRYYGGLYFSYQQAVELDSIAHVAFEHEGILRTKILAALLSTTSEIVNTVGKQFAQPLKVRDSNGNYKKSLRTKILQDRTMNVYGVFSKWLNYYLQIDPPTHNLLTKCADYYEALQELANTDIAAVYADPPYTRYHYSRYYHVLETICLRDNPVVTTTFPNGKGGISRAIYREGRHQSPFCIKSQAEEAFKKLFTNTAEKNIPLILSYSPFDVSKAVTPRLRTIDQLVGMAKNYYENVDIRSPGIFTHSKLNSTEKNFDANHEAELLIVCY